VFTAAERDAVRERLLTMAEEDPDVVGAAVTGSYAVGRSDEWSDVDVAFAIRGELDPALGRWAAALERELGAVHHWDLPWGSTIYRVFLLPDWLQVDIAFIPQAEFGARGPNWRTVFGATVDVGASLPPATASLVGMGWLGLRHGRTCIARAQPWQAEWSISTARDHILALACVRLGYPARFAKGADRLPRELTSALEETLVRSLDESELRRALAAVGRAYVAELRSSDENLARTLEPMVEDLTGP
jgi:predicted nucleotidyltransferase